MKKKDKRNWTYIIIIVLAIFLLSSQTQFGREANFGNGGGFLKHSVIKNWNPSATTCNGEYATFSSEDSGDRNVLVYSLDISAWDYDDIVITNPLLHFRSKILMDSDNADDGAFKVTIVSPSNDNCGECINWNQASNCGILSGGQEIFYQAYVNDDEYIDYNFDIINNALKSEIQEAHDNNRQFIYVILEAIYDNDGEAKGKIYTDEYTIPSGLPKLTYSFGQCDPVDPCCNQVPGAEYGSFKSNHDTTECGFCMECNGVDSSCHYQTAGIDYGNNCDSSPWTCTGLGSPASCSRTHDSGKCDGSGSCEIETIPISSENVCSAGQEVPASTINDKYSSISSTAEDCSGQGNTLIGFGEPIKTVYGCDGVGGSTGPAAGSKEIPCTGCCYDSGSTATCISSGTHSYDWYEFSANDYVATDYCLTGIILDCYDSTDCSAGSVCENNICIPPDCVNDNDCPTNNICDNNECLFVGCTSNSECGLSEVCNLGTCEIVDCVQDNQCSNGICLPSNTCGCTADSECNYLSVCDAGFCIEIECVSNGNCGVGESCSNNVCVTIEEPEEEPYDEEVPPVTPPEVPTETSGGFLSGMSNTIKIFGLFVLIFIIYILFEAGPNKGIFQNKKVTVQHRRGKRR